MNAPFELEQWSNLDSIYRHIWAALVRGAADRKDEFHLPVVATIRNGVPEQRVVVLRKAIEDERELWFHTDIRSAKVRDIRARSTCSLLFYHARKQFQVRVLASASIHDSDAVAKQQWERTSLTSRRCYCGEETPGEVVEKMTSGLPAFLHERQPTPDESEEGRKHFAVVRCTVQSLEWLLLHHAGHRRAKFEYGNDAIRQTWLVP
jgi:pyridoxine/pyridoxamine 5'-phosphate oxidase